MTDKITIERETVELAIAALTYHQNQTRPIESTRITLDTLRALLAAQPSTVDGHLKCGHHRSLAINSAETGEFLYCDLCDAKSRCRDAEAMEAELRAALAAQPAEPVEPVAKIILDTDGECGVEWIGHGDGLIVGAKLYYRAQPAPAAVPLTDEKIDHTLATTLDEFARTTRGMSHALDVNADITANSRLRRMFARAVLAAQPADAQQEPVAVVDENDEGKWADILPNVNVRVGDKLYAAQPAPAAVPPGYALVPIEPTHGMLSALTQEWHPSKHGPMKQRYRAMIAAAGDKQ